MLLVEAQISGIKQFHDPGCPVFDFVKTLNNSRKQIIHALHQPRCRPAILQPGTAGNQHFIQHFLCQRIQQ
jgi:hypothetical protein